MTTSPFSSSRCRCIAAVAGALIVIALSAALISLAFGAGVPDSWWPRTGLAFAADDRSGSAREDPCDLIVGPARQYCERGTSFTVSSADEAPRDSDSAGVAWTVTPPAAALAAVVVWRRRGAAGHGRH
ncbi:hypothetical protein [Streptomyces caniscabiei]|uniref:hypothetical protein n=1 Tax=Streptomyces caniscabiei TaxID=2746961 RepID=UPI000A387BA4|nr:hypothetical protein [Streptomyces caniscabiei]